MYDPQIDDQPLIDSVFVGDSYVCSPSLCSGQKYLKKINKTTEKRKCQNTGKINEAKGDLNSVKREVNSSTFDYEILRTPTFGLCVFIYKRQVFRQHIKFRKENH